jgi:hypothetical protein
MPRFARTAFSEANEATDLGVRAFGRRYMFRRDGFENTIETLANYISLSARCYQTSEAPPALH